MDENIPRHNSRCKTGEQDKRRKTEMINIAISVQIGIEAIPLIKNIKATLVGALREGTNEAKGLNTTEG